MLHIKKIIIALLVFASFVLTGCASVPDVNVQKLDKPLAEGSGIVVAETLTNSLFILRPISVWDELIVWKEGSERGEEDTFSISAVFNPVSSRFHIGSLPEGSYRVGLLWTEERYQGARYSAVAFTPKALGRFEVKSGHVTNLGTIIYQPFFTEALGYLELPDYAMTRVENSSLWSVLKQTNPVITRDIEEGNPVLSWLPDEYEEDRRRASENMKKMAIPTELFPLGGEDIVIGGKLGTLYKKSGQGWDRFSIPTTSQILSFIETDRQQWIVGGEYGFLAAAEQPYTDWRKIELPNPLMHVVDVGTNANGIIYVLARAGKRSELYLLDSETLTLTPWYSDTCASSMSSVCEYVPAVYLTDDELKFHVGAKLHKTKLPNNDRETIDVPKFRNITKLRNGNVIGGLYSFWSGGIDGHYSSNQGDDWVKFKGTASVRDQSLYRAKNGDVLNTSGELTFFGVPASSHMPLFFSRDEGESWKEIGRMPAGCEGLSMKASLDDALYLLCDGQAVYLSTDFAKTWNPIFKKELISRNEFPTSLVVDLVKLRKEREEELERIREEKRKTDPLGIEDD